METCYHEEIFDIASLRWPFEYLKKKKQNQEAFRLHLNYYRSIIFLW